jgi:type IV pilus assembly protein PilB
MSKQLELALRQSGLLTAEQLVRCADVARRRSIRLLDAIVKEGFSTEDALAATLASQLQLPRVKLAYAVSDPEALKRISDKTVRKHLCLPLSLEGKTLVVAMADPTDLLAIRDIEFASGLTVRPVVASHTELVDGIEERYAAADRIGTFLANVPDAPDLEIVAADSADLGSEAGDARSEAEVGPVVKMVNLIVLDAIKSGASDLHIEPSLHDVHVRMRVDGVLRDYTHVPKWLHSPVISRLKILAKLDIAERRLPQDGRINVQHQGRTIDIRVSTLPTHYGEKAVLRVLGGNTAPTIDSLGLNERQALALVSSAQQPQGMILVTGPTGSGKSTTLYALLQRRLSSEVNIITVEDPIEYQLAGINQVQVNSKAGLDFASVLRSILRQDPDVILVGEMRDRETAEVAFQAAMTGHLVLSTLHTNSAVQAVSRLFDIDVDPSILSSSLTLVIAQRLVRRICTQCKESYDPDAATRKKLGLDPTEGPIYRGRGCTACGGTGFSGRTGLYEFFKPTPTIRKLIHERAGEGELRSAARRTGMRLLHEDALEKVRQGITSPDEVLRVVQVDDSETPCPNCRTPIESDFSVCPYCLFTIRRTCSSCGQNLKPDWKICPYCNTAASVQALKAPAPDEQPRAGVFEKPPAEAPDHSESLEQRVTRRLAERRRARRSDDDVRLPGDTEPEWPTNLPVYELTKKPMPTDNADRIEAAALRMREAQATPPAAGPATPAAEPAPPAPAPTPAAPAAASGPSKAAPFDVGRTLRILVVDDDEDIRQVVAFTVRKLPMKVEIMMAGNGEEAVEKASAIPPDLIVLDVMMPKMDGFQACELLRQNVRTAFVPILMLTASADEANRSKGYLVGTDDYMSKPFLPPDLNLRITRLLRRTYGI